jgi:penicillin-binding protein 1A
LLRIHYAILAIDDELWAIETTQRLTDFEKLVILLEDRRFFSHLGIDLRSVMREVVKAATGQRHGGASTIDMQLFRTASDRYERTLRRKLREWLGVLIMQRKFTKLGILRAYLRIAYFGTGLKGSLAAARVLFPTAVDEFDYELDSSRLTLDEAAQLAALLVYPKPRLPNANWQAKVRRRADYGLRLYAGREKALDEVLR